MQKLVTLPSLSPAQQEALLDSFAALYDAHADTLTPRSIEGFAMLSASIEAGRRVFTIGQVDNMCHALEAHAQALKSALASPLASPSAHAAAERDLRTVQSVLSALLPLVPRHQPQRHPV